MSGRRQAPSALYSVRVETSRAPAKRLAACLEAFGVPLVVWEDADRDRAVLQEFVGSRAAATQRLAQMRACLTILARGRPWTATVRRLPARDWREAWKRFFHACRISPRVVVRPSWEKAPARHGMVTVVMNPGMSFGTGLHPTTRTCLRLLDAISRRCPGASFLDIGCGSGILSLAAARLGMRRVTAVDSDPEAVRIARRNAERNGLGRRVADVRTLRVRQPFGIVAANILADPLTRAADRIAAAVEPGSRSRLILSGILPSQYPAVRAAYERLGMEERGVRQAKEWVTAVFARQGTTGKTAPPRPPRRLIGQSGNRRTRPSCSRVPRAGG